jgi:hypothetical protein
MGDTQYAEQRRFRLNGINLVEFVFMQAGFTLVETDSILDQRTQGNIIMKNLMDLHSIARILGY